MNTRFFGIALALVGGCGGGASSTATPSPVASASSAQPASPPGAAPKAQATASSFACGTLNLSFGPTVPPDVGLGNQQDADCYGWQEFIALNWPSTGSSFGAPGDQSEVQWQGFMDIHQLFQPDASPPPAWGTPPQIDPQCQKEAGLTDAQARSAHPLVNATKFSSQFLTTSGVAQAFPMPPAPAWIGDVNGNNVWFEVRVNKDMYDYVVQNQFYNADKQLAFYTSQNPVTTPIQLPAGCNGPTSTCPETRTGAIELKAAWMEVPNPADEKWKGYKLSSAVVVDPKTQKCESVTVALVALHIIHKTESQPTWIWATFEHKLNAPDAKNPSSGDWNFNGSQCAEKAITVPSECQYKNQGSVTTSCAPNTPPQYNIGDGCPAATPTQVTRVNAIDATATTVNTAVQSAIQDAHAGSVWQNYVLVNVMWSTLPPSIPPSCKAGSPGCQRLTAPQLTQGLLPATAVANTVLETYIQNNPPDNGFAKSTCVYCHQQAQIPTAPEGTRYAADFSFALGEAHSPTGARKSSLFTAAPPKGGKVKKIRRIFR